MTKLFKEINDQLYDGAGDPQDVEDFTLHLSEGFIDPLAKLGFEFKEYAYAHLEINEGGVHIIEFDYQLDSLSKANEKKMVSICTQDDDSQPAANYRLWLGTLWLFIPYKA